LARNARDCSAVFSMARPSSEASPRHSRLGNCSLDHPVRRLEGSKEVNGPSSIVCCSASRKLGSNVLLLLADSEA